MIFKPGDTISTSEVDGLVITWIDRQEIRAEHVSGFVTSKAVIPTEKLCDAINGFYIEREGYSFEAYEDDCLRFCVYEGERLMFEYHVEYNNVNLALKYAQKEAEVMGVVL